MMKRGENKGYDLRELSVAVDITIDYDNEDF